MTQINLVHENSQVNSLNLNELAQNIFDYDINKFNEEIQKLSLNDLEKFQLNKICSELRQKKDEAKIRPWFTDYDIFQTIAQSTNKDIENLKQETFLTLLNHQLKLKGTSPEINTIINRAKKLYTENKLSWDFVKKILLAEFPVFYTQIIEILQLLQQLFKNQKFNLEVTYAHQLEKMEFKPINWLVPNLIPYGVSLLYSPPKLGKSLLLLSLAISLCSGGYFLGNIKLEKMNVLYMALEDNNRRLQSRIKMLSSGDHFPDNLGIILKWPKIQDNGLMALEEILEKQKFQCVIIDTLGRIMGEAAPNKDKYLYSVDMIESFRTLGEKYGVSFILVHHTRKGISLDQDFVDLSLGSQGIAATVDSLIFLHRERNEREASLFITGRDLEQEQELSLNFEQGIWSLNGQLKECRESTQIQKILDIMEESGDGLLKPKDIAEQSGLSLNTVKYFLPKMVKDGKIRKTGYGCYQIL